MSGGYTVKRAMHVPTFVSGQLGLQLESNPTAYSVEQRYQTVIDSRFQYLLTVDGDDGSVLFILPLSKKWRIGFRFANVGDLNAVAIVTVMKLIC